jgi:hypothetical protein
MNEENLNIAEEVVLHRSNADLLIKTFKNQQDVVIKYDTSSLKFLEDYIQSIKGQIDIDQMQRVLGVIDSFYGEAFIKNYGGKWDIKNNSWIIRFDEKNCVFPFNKVFKFYKNGSDDSFASMFSNWGFITNLNK